MSLINCMFLANTDVLVSGLTGQALNANGIYTLIEELPIDNGRTCALNPVYLGPTSNGIKYVLASFRPVSYIQYGSPFWFIIRVNASLSADDVYFYLLTQTPQFNFNLNNPILLLQVCSFSFALELLD